MDVSDLFHEPGATSATRRPYRHHLHHHCCWRTFTHAQRLAAQVLGGFYFSVSPKILILNQLES